MLCKCNTRCAAQRVRAATRPGPALSIRTMRFESNEESKYGIMAAAETWFRLLSWCIKHIPITESYKPPKCTSTELINKRNEQRLMSFSRARKRTWFRTCEEENRSGLLAEISKVGSYVLIRILWSRNLDQGLQLTVSMGRAETSYAAAPCLYECLERGKRPLGNPRFIHARGKRDRTMAPCS